MWMDNSSPDFHTDRRPSEVLLLRGSWRRRTEGGEKSGAYITTFLWDFLTKLFTVRRRDPYEYDIDSS